MQIRWPRRPRWTGAVVLLSGRRHQPAYYLFQACPLTVRSQSTASAWQAEAGDPPLGPSLPDLPDRHLWSLPSPPVERARDSPKLAALHARLGLPQKFPLETLARTLVDPTADSHPQFNNASFEQLGNNVMAYHCTEHVICHYPRIPMLVLYAAIYAYIGLKTLPHLVKEWGVECVAAPGGEVDPGLLQFRRHPPGTDLETARGSNRPNAHRTHWRRSISSRIVYDDEFGEPSAATANTGGRSGTYQGEDRPQPSTTLDRAQASFARAVVGAVYMHCGRLAAKSFVTDHFLSRQLAVSSLFDFREPTRDLSRLCAREGFEGPVARLISETGRHSRHPVFVVGVYSGDDKLGEAAGSSLDEARTKAAVAALKSWYLYSPLEVRLPSDTEEGGQKARLWKAAMIDGGEVIV